MFDIALIGAGRIGHIHAHNIATHRDLRLRYVIDPAEDSANSLATRYDAAVGSLEEALAAQSVRGIVVASATDAHLDQVLAARAAGKTIFCEKPLDLEIGRALAAADRLSGADVALLMGFNRRFDPHFSLLKQRLDAGEIGRLESLHLISHDPAPPPLAYVKRSGGLFKDMTIHDFDMARWLLGEEPVSVFAATACLVDPAIGEAGDSDTAKVILRTASDRICLISNSRRSGYGYDQRIEAFGAKGALHVGNVRESTVSRWGEPGTTSDAFQNFFLERYAESYIREMDHFAQMLGGHMRPSVGFTDALAALKLAEAAAESAERRCEVALK